MTKYCSVSVNLIMISLFYPGNPIDGVDYGEL